MRLDDALRDLILEIERDEPACLNIMLFGSHARGEAGPCSDIDVRLVTQGEPRRRDRLRFIRDEGGRWRHVSVGARSIEELRVQAREADAWSWMTPMYAAARVLAGSEAPLLELQATLASAKPDPWAAAGDAQKHLEDLLETTGKMQNAAIASDPTGVLHFALSVAECAWRLLRGLNPVEPFGSSRRLLEAMTQIDVAPPHYAEDTRHCLGSVEGPRTAAEVRRHALRSSPPARPTRARGPVRGR